MSDVTKKEQAKEAYLKLVIRSETYKFIEENREEIAKRAKERIEREAKEQAEQRD